METVRSLERGLSVLRALDDGTALTLADLHARTTIPKPSLLRILRTLQQTGWLWKAIGDGRYRRCHRLPGAVQNSSRIHGIAQAAASHLQDLQRKVIWPSDLLMVQRGTLVLIETSRRICNLGVFPYPIGYRVDLFLSAPGRVWLAFCTPREREGLLEHARRHPPPLVASRSVLQSELPAILALAQEQGYASRDPRFGGSDRPIREFDDGLDAIAVPVMARNRILACMNLVWPRKYRLKHRILREHLGDLQAAAAGLGREIAAMRTR